MLKTPDLLRAYQATIYRVLLPGGSFDLHIGQFSPDLQGFLIRENVSGMAILTAENPASVCCTAEANALVNQALLNDLVMSGRMVFAAENHSADAQWPLENAFAVFSISLDEACRLGRKYGQNAIVFMGNEAVPQLYWME